MEKYLAVYKISFQQEFVYRLNFIMWRLRNVTQIFLIFFLWDTVFSDPSRIVLGYDRVKILTYVFGILVIKAIVTSVRSIDVPGEISRGELSNYLLKPINYFKYWFIRDLSSKSLNLTFAVFEFLILYLILRPVLFLQTNFFQILLFLASLILAILLYFLILFLLSMLPFWYSEQAWGTIFLLFIFVDFLGGGIFPIDILPHSIQQILYLTPFPYLLFFPLQIYLGKLKFAFSLKGILVSLTWVFFLALLLKAAWKKGLKVYKAEGR